MALLPKKTRIKYFEFLGLNAYNETAIKAFQRMAFTDPKEWDGRFGEKTNTALKHWYNVKKNCTHFEPAEFRCKCGRCTGYPTQMRVKELKHIETIRKHYDRPMVVTSALRCEYGNKKVGGVPNSGHLFGRAVDFFMSGVTDTLDNRKGSIPYIKKLPNHKYTYGHGINSYGEYVYKPQMGNALHTEVKP